MSKILGPKNQKKRVKNPSSWCTPAQQVVEPFHQLVKQVRMPII
jgi:hypothetical protein